MHMHAGGERCLRISVRAAGSVQPAQLLLLQVEMTSGAS